MDVESAADVTVKAAAMAVLRMKRFMFHAGPHVNRDEQGGQTKNALAGWKPRPGTTHATTPPALLQALVAFAPRFDSRQ